MHMKILIVFVLLTLAALVRSDGAKLRLDCRNQFTQQTILGDQCINRLVTTDDFYREFNTTVIEFSGNDADRPVVEEFFTKYCGILPKFLKCFDFTNNLSAECRTQLPNQQMRNILFRLMSSVAHYACQADADVLKKLLPHDGYKFFFLNDDFDRCVAHVEDFENSSALCLSLEKSISCIEETIGNHPNKDIAVIAREVFNRFKLAANCHI